MILARRYYRGKLFLETMVSSIISTFRLVGKSMVTTQDLDLSLEGQQNIRILPLLLIDRNDKCDGCMDCVEICPTDCLKIEKGEHGQFSLDIDGGRCLYCNYCAEVCHFSVITLVKDYLQESS